MELWEFNACVRAYIKKLADDDTLNTVLAWRIGNFTGAAMGGKLKKLSHYLKGTEPEQVGQTMTREDMDEFDRRYAAQRGGSACHLRT